MGEPETAEVVLIDLSSIAHPIWHMSQTEPDPNHTSQQIVARVRAITSGKPSAAICCDSGRSFRYDITPTYKANRPAAEAPLHHQISLAKEQLVADGFPVWSAKGFEADDIIATATRLALEAKLNVLIVSADKDLLQLVFGARVRAMSVRDGSILGAAEVVEKFGVRPSQIRDYLTLVGDASDNIKGAKGIGPKRAAELLAKFDTIDGIYKNLAAHGSDFTPSIATALREFAAAGALETARQLVTLRYDVPDVPFAEISGERRPKDVESFISMEDEPMVADVIDAVAQVPLPVDEPTKPAVEPVPVNVQPTLPPVSAADIKASAPAVVAEVVTSTSLVPVDYERELDPRSMRDAQVLAKHMFESRMFSAYGTPQAVLSTVMLGRELGLPAMASLRGVHVIEGKHSLSASLMVALVLKSGLAEFFEPVSFDDKQATFETKRKGARNPVTLTHTIEQATQAGLVKPNSNWLKIPAEMLMARAQARLARLVYPDLLAGLYTPDELVDSRAEGKAA